MICCVCRERESTGTIFAMCDPCFEEFVRGVDAPEGSPEHQVALALAKRPDAYEVPEGYRMARMVGGMLALVEEGEEPR